MVSGCLVLVPGIPVGLDDVGTEGVEEASAHHSQHRHPGRQPHLHVHPCQQASQNLLQEHVGRQKHGDRHRGEQEAVCHHGLRRPRHELWVVETDEQQDGEEGEQAAVEDLRNQDHVHARS